MLALEYDVSVEEYFTKTEKNYFLYLMNIDKNIFITDEVREILPHSLKTIKDFYNISLEKKLEMFEVLRNEDITLDEFEKRFFNTDKL
ncbi:MAG: hypothetical protein LBD88_04085 [Candidatus Peribacteria bacterium]|nr:hypothetical protein [Candidatus Peribacteria bacterium]